MALHAGDLDEIVALLASDTGGNEKDIVERIEKLAEVNPMLGRAWCKMGLARSLNAFLR